MLASLLMVSMLLLLMLLVMSHNVGEAELLSLSSSFKKLLKLSAPHLMSQYHLPNI